MASSYLAVISNALSASLLLNAAPTSPFPSVHAFTKSA
jgi:hypothetical protein